MSHSPPAKRRRHWTGPIVVVVCAFVGLVSMGGLAYYRITNGWSSPIADIDRDVIVTAGDIEPMFKELPVRLDSESWSKIWKPGERCEITYHYDHPDASRPLVLRSYAYRFANRRECFEKFTLLTKKLITEMGETVPEATYVARDKELPIDDESRFGSFNVEDRPVAYFFARRRGLNIYIGFIRSDEIDDATLGEIFEPPIDHLEDWSPSQ